MQRRHDLDWVRIFAFGVLVLYHVGMYYVSWDWHVNSPGAVRALEPVMMLSAPWRLSLLFLVSGMATAFLLARMRERGGGGPGGFLGSRSRRLLLPLAFGMLVIVPPQSYYELLDSRFPGGYHDGYLAFWGRYLAAESGFCDDDGCLSLPTWNHLWFVAYLWTYSVVLWLLLKLAPQRLPRLGERLGRALSGAGLLLWPVLFLALARLALVARFPSTHALVDDWYNHVQYFGLFLLGVLIAANTTVWARIEALRWPALLAALATYAFIAWYFGHFGDGRVPSDTLRLIQRAAWGVNQWTAIVAILGFARRLAPGDGPARRYLSEAVFPVYILHQTIIVALAYNARPLGLPPLLEGPLLIALTLALCFAGYEIVRRVPWLRPLFGLNARPRKAGAEQPLAGA